MSIVWDNAKFGTGLQEVDAQHKEWLHRFNEFDEAVMQGRERDIIFQTLAFLMEYTGKHFTFEEAEMARCRCPGQRENIAAHEKFRMRLDDILQQIEVTGPSLFDAMNIKLELEQWLTNHICTIDINLRGCK